MHACYKECYSQTHREISGKTTLTILKARSGGISFCHQMMCNVFWEQRVVPCAMSERKTAISIDI